MWHNHSIEGKPAPSMPPLEPVCDMKVSLGGLLEGWSFRDQDSDQSTGGVGGGANLKNLGPEAKVSFLNGKRAIGLEFPIVAKKQGLEGRSMSVMIMGGLEIK